MKRFILKHKFLITVLAGILGGLLTLAICSYGQNERNFSRYGLHDYKSGLQKVFNICKADPNITVVAYYKMGGAGPGIPDLSGNGLNLTASGTPTYRQPDYLGLNRAILFNPVTVDYFYHSDDALFNLGTDYDCVIWIIAKTSDIGNYCFLVEKIDVTSFRFYKSDTNKLYGYINDGTHNAVAGSSPTTINDGNYKLLMMILNRDSATGFKVGINGILYTAANPTSVGNLDSTANFTIGKTITTWNGSISEILMIKGNPLPDWAMSPEFALLAYKLSMGWPKTLPREMQ